MPKPNLYVTARLGITLRTGRHLLMPVSKKSNAQKSRARKSSEQLESIADSVNSVLHLVRGERIILDVDLARIYGVDTRVLNQAVRRNRGKFPPDFLLELTRNEAFTLNRSQSVIGSQKHRDQRAAPFAFTEHGALMAANILSSPQATHMSVFVIRAFVKMRSILTETGNLAEKLTALETELKSRLDSHETAIVDVLQRIMALLDPPPSGEAAPPPKEMGFHTTLPTDPRGHSLNDT